MGKTKKKINKNDNVKSVNICAGNSKVSKKPVVLVGNSKKVSKKKKGTRLNYSADDVVNALKAMDTGISIRKAATAYGVPVATLFRRKTNPELTKKKTGPATVFSQTEELKIVDWILFRAQRGSPVTKTELLDSIQQYVKLSKKETPFIDCRPSRHWYEGFIKRHPQLSIKKPQHLTISRAAVTSDDLKDWFEEQKSYLTEKNLNNIGPERTFNCDETYVSLCPPSEKVLLDKGSRSAYKVVDSDKEGFTVLFMYSANETWKKAVPKWKNLKGVTRIKKEDFPLVLKFALDNMSEEKKAVASGFRAAGLYPFDPSAIDYDIFNKRKKSKKTVHEKKNEDDVTEDNQKHLLTFEKNLSKELLQEFRDAAVNQTWPKDLQKKGLFEYWLNISGRPGINIKGKPIIQEVALVNVNLNEIRQEQFVDNSSYNQASTSNNFNLNDRRFSSVESDLLLSIDNSNMLQESSTVINGPVLNKVSAPEIYEIILESNSVDIFGEPQSCTDENNCSNSLELGLQEMPINTDYKNTSTTTVIAASTINECLESPGSDKCKKSMIDKENNSPNTNTEVSTDAANNFKNAFTLPTNYLPKKKRIKVESSGKPKLPSAGTSDQWMQFHLEKENKRKIKEEKLQQRKKLQEEKKILAEEKKKLQDKMREIQKKIKLETK